MIVPVGTGAANHFAGTDQSGREHWRSIVLFGRNVASYKFALAKSLLELSQAGEEKVPLDLREEERVG